MEFEKASFNQPTYNHNISLHDRKRLEITGVRKIENFDSNEFLLETSLGMMKIKGNELEIIKLDTNVGEVNIKGQVNEIHYSNSDKKNKNTEGILARLFKW